MGGSGLGNGAGRGGSGFVAALRRALATLTAAEEAPELRKAAGCGEDAGAPSLGWGGPATLVAQPFVPAEGGVLRRVEVGGGKPPSTAGDFLIRVVKAPGGVPSLLAEDVLAEASVPDDAVPEDEEASLAASFKGPALEAGAEYAVVVGRPGSAEWAFLTVGGASCGNFFTADDGDPAAPFRRTVRPLALRFAVYVA